MVTAGGGVQALAEMEGAAEFAVIVADLRMPEMDGVTLFERTRDLCPDSTRVLLTGHADLETSLAAINDGRVFRLLLKPCPPESLRQTLLAGAEQYRLVKAERELLEETLWGCVRTLSEVLSITSPAAFGRTMRLLSTVREFSLLLGCRSRWEIEVPTMLSQIGAVTLPNDTADRLYFGRPMRSDEDEMVARLPQVAGDLLANIPRLETVREILLYQNKNFDGSGWPEGSIQGEAIPWGARVLKIVLDHDDLETRGESPAEAIESMRNRSGWYDPQLLDRFALLCGAPETAQEIREVSIGQLQTGMVFREDVRTSSGVLLIARGQAVTPGLIRRLTNLSPQCEIQDIFRVVIPGTQIALAPPERTHG